MKTYIQKDEKEYQGNRYYKYIIFNGIYTIFLIFGCYYIWKYTQNSTAWSNSETYTNEILPAMNNYDSNQDTHTYYTKFKFLSATADCKEDLGDEWEQAKPFATWKGTVSGCDDLNGVTKAIDNQCQHSAHQIEQQPEIELSNHWRGNILCLLPIEPKLYLKGINDECPSDLIRCNINTCFDTKDSDPKCPLEYIRIQQDSNDVQLESERGPRYMDEGNIPVFFKQIYHLSWQDNNPFMIAPVVVVSGMPCISYDKMHEQGGVRYPLMKDEYRGCGQFGMDRKYNLFMDSQTEWDWYNNDNKLLMGTRLELPQYQYYTEGNTAYLVNRQQILTNTDKKFCVNFRFRDGVLPLYGNIQSAWEYYEGLQYTAFTLTFVSLLLGLISFRFYETVECQLLPYIWFLCNLIQFMVIVSTIKPIEKMFIDEYPQNLEYFRYARELNCFVDSNWNLVLLNIISYLDISDLQEFSTQLKIAAILMASTYVFIGILLLAGGPSVNIYKVYGRQSGEYQELSEQLWEQPKELDDMSQIPTDRQYGETSGFIVNRNPQSQLKNRQAQEVQGIISWNNNNQEPQEAPFTVLDRGQKPILDLNNQIVSSPMRLNRQPPRNYPTQQNYPSQQQQNQPSRRGSSFQNQNVNFSNQRSQLNQSSSGNVLNQGLYLSLTSKTQNY